MPVRIVNLTDAEALEAQLIENLQRRDVHPLEEAQGFRALLNLEEPKYSIEQIAAKTGKSPAYVAQRLKLTELAPAVVNAFYKEEIGVGRVRVRRLQCDEIWCFVGAKSKNVTIEQKEAAWGDVWTWTAIDADSKLCGSYLVRGRSAGWANDFMEDCASRIRGRVQLTTDGHKAYLEAVESAFGVDVDFATPQKIYGASDEPEKRYLPAKCIGCEMKAVIGNPDPQHVSTSFVERE